MGTPTYLLEGVVKQRGPVDSGFRLRIDHLAIPPGSQSAIIGRSGSGKSTCLDLLALSLSPTRADRFDACFGDVSPDDHSQPKTHEVGKLWSAGNEPSLAKIRRQHIGYILQTGGLLPFLNVFDNITVMARDHGQEIGGRADDLIERLALGQVRNQLPRALSIGERQRVAVARALVTHPEVVLADEPTASLDEGNADEVMDLFLELAAAQSTAIVLVTHDVELARRFGFRLVHCRPASPVYNRAHDQGHGVVSSNSLSIIDDRLAADEDETAALIELPLPPREDDHRPAAMEMVEDTVS